jgi:hypothetical protein
MDRSERYLYAAGGRQRTRLIQTEDEWNLYERALILQVNVADGTASVCVEYQSPPEVCPSEKPSFLFKTAALHEGVLYVCSSTEVLAYEIPGFRQVGYVSLPRFNDLHHVNREANGKLLVANTGLDTVVECDLQGKVWREWSVLGEDPWERFSRTTDYRKIATTKPHRAHPCHVFQLGEDIWVTRGDLGDALCLTRPGRISVAQVGIHDGHLFQGHLYFTTVDGTIVIVDAGTLQKVDVIDLKPIHLPERALLGWCRGLLIANEREIWVGFTRIRKTKFKEKVNWIKHVFHDTEKPTHIALYDIVAKKCLDEIDLERNGLNVIFSIHHVDRS